MLLRHLSEVLASRISELTSARNHQMPRSADGRLGHRGRVTRHQATSGDLPAGILGTRWPNDVEVGRKKLAGILPERVETASGPRLVIGIGLNVRARLDIAPDEVGRLATSLEVLSATSLTPEDVERLFRAILERFGSVLDRLV